MESDLEKAINVVNLQLHLFTAVRQEISGLEGLVERDIMILEILNRQGAMTVTRIAKTFTYTSESTISTAITKLWRDRKLVSKKRDDQNQRIRIIELTDKGKKAIEELYIQRAEKFYALFEEIQATKEERQVLLKILTRIKMFFNNDPKIESDKNQ